MTRTKSKAMKLRAFGNYSTKVDKVHLLSCNMYTTKKIKETSHERFMNFGHSTELLSLSQQHTHHRRDNNTY